VPPPRPLPYAAHLSLSSHVLTHTHTRARPHPHPSQLALAAALALVGSAAASLEVKPMPTPPPTFTSGKFSGKLAALEMLSNKTDEVKDEAWEMAAWKLNKTVHMVSVGRGETRGEARDRGWRSSRPLLPPPRKKTHPAPLLSSPLTAPPHPHPTRTHRPTRCSSTRTRPTRRSSESMQKRREGIVALWRRGSHHPNLNTLTPPLLHPIHTIRSLSKFEDHVDAKFDMLIEGLNETYQKIEGAKEEVEVRGKVQNGKTDRCGDGWGDKKKHACSLSLSFSLSPSLSLSLSLQAKVEEPVKMVDDKIDMLRMELEEKLMMLKVRCGQNFRRGFGDGEREAETRRPRFSSSSFSPSFLLSLPFSNHRTRPLASRRRSRRRLRAS
jgi:hypothetical protein